MEKQNCVIINSVNFSYGKKEIIKNVSLSLKQGEVWGLVGPNGAGKTTLLKIISGLYRPGSGNVIINGLNMSKDTNSAYKKLGIQIEDTAAYEHLTGYDNLKILFNMYDEKECENSALELLSLVGLKDVAYEKFKTYSLGMKKRLGIAMALINKPSILILDEPTNGLDIDGIRTVRRLVKEYAKETGATILISSHITSELENTCDNIAFLIDGEIRSVNSIHDFANITIEDYYVNLLEDKNA